MVRDEKKELQIKKTLDDLLKQMTEYFEINPETDFKNSLGRVHRMLVDELLIGYSTDPKIFLKTFKANERPSLTIENIPIKSLCEHHFLPIYGYATIIVKYKEGAEILGMSKYYRIVDCFSRKFQLQERLTREIAEFFFQNLQLDGIVVKTQCEHYCMKMRGINVGQGDAVCVKALGCFQKEYE